MDECEVLCDRIAIMANGRIRCMGTASDLKRRYAKGFQLTLKLPYERLQDQEYIERVKSHLANQFPNGLKYQDFHMNTMDFLLSDISVSWSSLFDRLCSAQSDLNLIEFVVQPTTLEQVFLSFANEE